MMYIFSFLFFFLFVFLGFFLKCKQILNQIKDLDLWCRQMKPFPRNLSDVFKRVRNILDSKVPDISTLKMLNNIVMMEQKRKYMEQQMPENSWMWRCQLMTVNS